MLFSKTFFLAFLENNLRITAQPGILGSYILFQYQANSGRADYIDGISMISSKIS